ncbi:TPA: hypothetical protein ACJIXP_003912 [Escherichia coli]|uniref:hypothetical protein n=1 Tax=Escherichia coli TaxID=562 RepID=UPI002FBDE59E
MEPYTARTGYVDNTTVDFGRLAVEVVSGTFWFAHPVASTCPLADIQAAKKAGSEE